MQIVTIANQKGGTAKTTTAATLAQAAADQGKRVLAIDLDPQGNLSFFLAADTSRPGSFEILAGTETAENTIQRSGSGIDAIPASWNLATIASSTGSARRLQRALEPIKGSYDLIIIDTPPTAGELQYNALQASTGLIIPLQADIVSLHGLYQISDTAHQIQESNPELEITGTILTRHNGRSIISQQMTQSIMDKSQELQIPFLGIVREAVTVKEAQTLQRSLYEYAPKSNPARDYKIILQKIMED